MDILTGLQSITASPVTEYIRFILGDEIKDEDKEVFSLSLRELFLRYPPFEPIALWKNILLKSKYGRAEANIAGSHVWFIESPNLTRGSLKILRLLKTEADNIEALKNVNASESTICSLLKDLYLRNEEYREKFRRLIYGLVDYVGKSVLNRLEAIETEKDVINTLYTNGLITEDRKDTAISILDTEASSIKSKWDSFKTDIDTAISSITTTIDSVRDYIKNKMSSYCTTTW